MIVAGDTTMKIAHKKGKENNSIVKKCYFLYYVLVFSNVLFIGFSL